ncbi:MAG: amidohydrolase family protein, partial [Chitinophagaceae bacterium]|nr:amidohydrolase family protein [Chitinophagaceae bacterium]
GDILTMEADTPQYVESVVTKDDTIVFTGNFKEAKEKYNQAVEYDLQGKILMPGFIEPHAHPVSLGAFILANEIIAPHEWKMPHKTFPAVVGHENYLKALKEMVNNSSTKNDYVVVWGYHKAWQGDITKDEINKATGNIPTIIYQRSGHEIFLNDAAMKKFNIDVNAIPKDAQEQMDVKNNHFWERAYQLVKATQLQPVFNDSVRLKIGLHRMSDMMLQNGITSMMEPSFPNTTFEDEYPLLKEEAERTNRYMMYLIPGFPEQYTLKKSNEEFDKYIKGLTKFNTANITFLTDQYKTFSDGAIYSLAMELRKPYLNCPTCKGEWIVPPAYQKTIFNYYWDHGYKIHIHVTGDAGLESYLQLLEEAMKRNPRKNHGTTFHHLGVFGEDQAERMAKVGAEASVNPYYLYAMGNKYAEIGLGPERAHAITAMKWLTSRKIPTSLHSDFAMAPAEPLTLAWVATTRISDNGTALRPDLGCTVYEALKGITIDAANTFSQEDKIGSIKTGKQATFTILNQNPLKVPATTINKIAIDGIVYKGVYHKNSFNQKP